MELTTLTMDKNEARQKFLEYRDAVRARHFAEDAEIMRGYRALSQGSQLVELTPTIKAGGVFEKTGLPRLAVATASHLWVHCERNRDGAVSFLPKQSWDLSSNRKKDVFRFGPDTLPRAEEPKNLQNSWARYWGGRFRAMVPNVPPSLRPATSLDGYAILFEVEEWALDPAAPRDPALLKHIGGDLYAVVAIWDLTPLERAVLARRNA